MKERERRIAGASLMAVFACLLMLTSSSPASASPATHPAGIPQLGNPSHNPSPSKTAGPLVTSNPWYAGARPDTNAGQTHEVTGSLVTPDDIGNWVGRGTDPTEGWQTMLVEIVQMPDYYAINYEPSLAFQAGFTMNISSGLFYPFARMSYVSNSSCQSGVISDAPANSVTVEGSASLRAYTAYNFTMKEEGPQATFGTYHGFNTTNFTVTNPAGMRIFAINITTSNLSLAAPFGDFNYSGTHMYCSSNVPIQGPLFDYQVVEQVQTTATQEAYPDYSFASQTFGWTNSIGAFQMDTTAWNTFTDGTIPTMNLTLSAYGSQPRPVYDSVEIANEKFGIFFCASYACTPWEPAGVFGPNPGPINSINCTPYNVTQVQVLVEEYAIPNVNITNWATPVSPSFSWVQSTPGNNMFGKPTLLSHVSLVNGNPTTGTMRIWLVLSTSPYYGGGTFGPWWTDYTEGAFTITWT
jgi:hypothetical protein